MNHDYHRNIYPAPTVVAIIAGIAVLNLFLIYTMFKGAVLLAHLAASFL